ncbi:MAG: GNAT family N-acetyltransferase [Oceanicaulis sp.]
MISDTCPDEHAPILALYPRAFSGEDLTGLVAELLPHRDVLNLTARVDGAPAGHAAFSRCGLEGRSETAALLGPLCVDPEHQRSGLGRALIAEGARRLAAEGAAELLVLGDPAYYGKLGFDAPSAIAAPYALKPEWAEAWRSMRLSGAERITEARLVVPEPWRKPALWG